MTEQRHPIPTQRRVVISALDKRARGFDLTRLLSARGLDVTLPYTQEPGADDTDDVYVQEIPQDQHA